MMVKCSQCGAEYPDGPKFCKLCGNKLVNSIEERCPTCGEKLEPDSVFCGYCGAKIVREKCKVCPSCGAEYPLKLKFCVKDGTELREAETTIKSDDVSTNGAVELTSKANDASTNGAVELTSKSDDVSTNGAVKPTAETDDVTADGVAEPAAKTDDVSAGGAATQKSAKAAAVNGFINKAVAFENKHLVIRNGVIALLSLLFVFFALLLPVNVMGYGDDELIYTDGFEDISEVSDINNEMVDGEDYSLACHPVKVKQSIWKMLAALKYINLDLKDKSDHDLIERIIKDYEEAVRDAKDEAFDEVAVKSASTGNPMIPQSKMDEYYKELEKSLSKHLSKINYLAYLLAKDAAPGPYAVDVTSSVFGAVIAVLSILIAVTAVVALVFAIIGMVKRKQMLGLTRFLKIATVASGVVALITAFNPLGKAGGAMFTIFMISAVVWLLSGVTQTIINGNIGLFKLICRSAFAVLLIIGMALLLCTNSICIRMSADITKNSGNVNTSASVLYKVYAPVGALFAEALDDAVSLLESGDSALDLTGVIISGIASYAVAIIALSVLLASVVSALKVLASTDPNKKLPLILPIVSAVFVFVFIIVTGVVSNILFSAFAEPTKSEYVGFNIEKEVLFTFYARTQVYFTLVFALATAVFSLVLRLKKNAPPVEPIAEPIAEPATVDAGATGGEPSGYGQGEQRASMCLASATV